MSPCSCGKAVRLGGTRVRVNRKNGVYHHIVHLDDSPVCVPGQWTSLMFKPYPKLDHDKPWHKMLARWNDRPADGSAGK